MSNTELVYPRDASWYSHSSKSGYAYHRASVTDPGVAACSRLIVLSPDGVQRSAVPTLICHRPACAKDSK